MNDQNNHLLQAQSSASTVDLGPLAWVVDALRDNLNTTRDQLLYFSQEMQNAEGGGYLTTSDTTTLRMAGQNLHDAVGVLDVVERPAAAQVLRVMEQSLQRFVANPELCTPEAIEVISSAGVAVLDYVTSVLKGRTDHSVGLFPIYAQVAHMADLERIHPADLWNHEWKWLEAQTNAPMLAGAALPASAFLMGVLKVFQSQAQEGVKELEQQAHHMWGHSTQHEERVFWQLVTGFFQTLSIKAVDFDEHVKRLISRIAVQYDLAKQGKFAINEITERLAKDVLFFIALGQSNQKNAVSTQLAPIAQSIVQRYKLEDWPVCGYERLLYGKVDPAVQEALRRDVTTFKELWTDVSAGNVSKIDTLQTHLEPLASKLQSLWPESAVFTSALQSVVSHVQSSAQQPHADVAMEVATSILFVEGVLADGQSDEMPLGERMATLAKRLNSVQQGQALEPLEPWMETLYAQLNDADSIARAVAESRAMLGEIEQDLDDFFRHPQKMEQARASIGKLGRIAGVLAMLDCADASRAVSVMAQQVQQLITASEQTSSIDDENSGMNVLHLGNSLSALSFMFDMIGYQPERARQLFVFDEQLQELVHIKTPLPVVSPSSAQEQSASSLPVAPEASSTSFAPANMGAPEVQPLPMDNQAVEVSSTVEAPTALAAPVAPIASVEPPSVSDSVAPSEESPHEKKNGTFSNISEGASQAAAALDAVQNDGIRDDLIDDDELRGIFLEEAEEVLVNALIAVDDLQADMNDAAKLTNLRRAFHTLKGSSRMVGLASFGEAAWEMERVLNAWLADSKPASPALLQLASNALDVLGQWRVSIAQNEQTPWHHSAFKQPAQQMNEHGEYLPITLPNRQVLAQEVVSDKTEDVAPEQVAVSVTEEQAPAVDASAIEHDVWGLLATPEDVAPAADAQLSQDAVDSLFADDWQAELPIVEPMAEASEVSAASQAAAGDAWNSAFHEINQALSGIEAIGSTNAQPLEPVVSEGASEDTGAGAVANVKTSDTATNSVEDGIARGADASDSVFAEEDNVPETVEVADPMRWEDSVLDESFTAEVLQGALQANTEPTQQQAISDNTAAADDAVFADATPSEVEAASIPTEQAAAPSAEQVAERTIEQSAEQSVQESVFADAPEVQAPEKAVSLSAFIAAQTMISPSVAGMLVDVEHQQTFLQDMVDGLPEEEVKRIGDLRIPLALFNAYLNEADTWSRTLTQELSEWVLNCTQQVPESCAHLAHSLAGSSAAVGMSSLASIARGVEHAVDRLRNRTARADEAQVLFHASETLRQELHQFAAGVVRTLDVKLLVRLAAIVDNVSQNAIEQQLAAAAQWQTLASAIEKKTIQTETASSVDSDVAAVADVTDASDVTDVSSTKNAIDTQEPSAHEFVHEEPALLDESEQLDAQDTAEAHDAVGTASDADEASAALFAEEEDALFAEESTALADQAAEQTVGQPLEQSAVQDASSVFASSESSEPSTPAAQTVEPQDNIDPDLFDIFREEAETLMTQLSSAMRQWGEAPNNEGVRQEIMRLLHTFKGGARLAGAMKLGDMAHEMESAVGSWYHENRSAQDIELLQIMLDDMNQQFVDLQENHVGDTQAAVTDTHQADMVSAPASDAVSGFEADAVAQFPMAEQEMVVFESEEETQIPTQVQSPIVRQVDLSEIAMPVTTHVAAPKRVQQQVRVRANVLDQMLGQTGEIMTNRSRLETEVEQMRRAVHEMDDSLARLRTQLRDMELQAETQMQSRLSQASAAGESFDPLEFDRFTRVQELTRMMAESVDDVASVQRSMARSVQSTEDSLLAQSRHTKELQDDLLRARMVEFDSLSERLYRLVRQASKEVNKQVHLDIAGGHIEMDRTIVDRIVPVFEHLLRNAVVHGIEDAASRSRHGKDAVGKISIRLRQEGNDVYISVRDDGQGLDTGRIREKAITQGLLPDNVTLSDDEAAQLIFRSGLSTAEQVTSLAGRGVGMDVVRAEITSLGGRIDVKTQAQKGTEFLMALPLTTAVTTVVVLRVGDRRFGVPSNLVETVKRATAKDVEQAYNAQAYTLNGEALPFYWAGAMIAASHRSEDIAAKRQTLVVIQSAAQRLVLHVDAVEGTHEVVVKNLGPQLERMPGLSGMAVLPSGNVLFIYNPVALATVYGDQIRSFSKDWADPSILGGSIYELGQAPKAEPVTPLIMVVDDSITVRRVTERLLKREGYRVVLAQDGMAALRELATEKPSLVLSDIEMPQMDGFDLLRNIRNDQNLQDLPVIMITSRTADKHREMAEQLGATGYLGKPYQEDQLLELIKHHVSAAQHA